MNEPQEIIDHLIWLHEENRTSFLSLSYNNYNLVMEFFSFHECKWKLSTGVIASFYPIAFSPECKINIKLLKPGNFKKSQLQFHVYSWLFLSW